MSDSEHRLEGERWQATVTGAGLQPEALARFVADPGAGAISSFLGLTRNNFGGKEVLRLEYEAYGPMAAKKLGEVCEDALGRFEVSRVAVAHRTGTVGVGEASVAIAASSPHRLGAIEACHWMIDELKAIVPIWKKEFFADGSMWKENAESRLAHSKGARAAMT